tara:strand:- start:40 stop:699 length:660 start_codon:yes stop_codon:yes gene_type:complete
MAFILDGTTGIATVDGSVSAPSQRGQDTNSGISYGADTIKFSTGGVERISITNSGISGTGISAGGLTVGYQFRLTSGLSVSNSATTLSANWETVDGTGQGVLGSFPDPSSGIFTFPSTGIYLVRFNGYFEDTGDTPLAQLRILATTNNSSYSAIAEVNTSNSNLDTYTYCSASVESLIDVTDVSNVKVYFDARNTNTATLDGSSTQNRTYVTFIRLGDT